MQSLNNGVDGEELDKDSSEFKQLFLLILVFRRWQIFWSYF